MTRDEQRDAEDRADLWVAVGVLGVYVVLVLIGLWALWMTLG